MQSDSDALPGCSSPESVERVYYPEHTLLSLAIMVLLSAGVLYAMERVLEERVTIVQSWSFASSTGTDGPWTFPGADFTHTEMGATYTASQTGPGPMLTLDFDASTASQVRVTMSVTRVADGRTIPFSLEWYWAGPAQISAAAGGWPFSTERGKAFIQPDRHRPELNLVNLHDHPGWTGPVAKAFISLKFPEDETGPFRIETRKIEFLE